MLNSFLIVVLWRLIAEMNKEWIDISYSIKEWAKWAGIRLLVITPAVALEAGYWLTKGLNILFDSSRKSYYKLLTVYDALPYKGMPGTMLETNTARLISSEVTIEPITDIFAEIEGKQLMILGEMGSGKSTIAQYFAYTVGGKVKVYECEGTPEDWQGLEVIGEGENWEAINKSMADDLEDLSNQLKLRKEKGDSALNGTEKVIIAEEFPELVSKCGNCSEWLDRHARRGRKARRFTILLSQYDRVGAWGMEGKSDLLDAFRRLRLGKKAVNHARLLKRDDLAEWLRRDRAHVLLDDYPAILPGYREMKSVTQRLPMLMEATAVTPVEPAQTGLNSDSELTLWRAISAHLASGRGESWIIKEILGYQGSSYQRGREIFQALKSRFS